MFTRYGKREKPTQSQPIKDLIAIASPQSILKEEKRSALLLQIEQLCVLDSVRFDTLAMSLLNHLINHCQLLPETSNRHYSQSGGLLDYALNRTEAGLSLFRQFITVENGQEWSEEQKLWQYALYTAALLQGIGKLQIDYKVNHYNTKGQLSGTWNPLINSLAATGNYYTFTFENEVEITFRQRLNILMARLLMPTEGFTWIASNPEVLAVWLALLNEDYQGAGTLGAILIRADALALRRYFQRFLTKGDGGQTIRTRVGTFANPIPESITDLETKTGIKFIEWLYTSLESGKIIINKAPLLMVPGGMLMCAEVFQWFVREHPEYKNWLAVKNGFLSLGLHQTKDNNETNFRFEQNNSQQMNEGIVCADYAVLLPDEVKFHQAQSGKMVTMSAMEVIHQADAGQQMMITNQSTQAKNSLLHLSASGKWQAPPIDSSKHSMGITSRG